jgi:hypothetical protein
MANTQFAKLPALSNKIYKEWLPKTVLVQSCDDAFEGEFDLENREIDIPVYHDISIHQTTIKENELKPAPVEFISSSTKRVSIDKGRYSHWGETNLGKLINKLSKDNSEVRRRLVNKWAIEAEKELAEYCAQLKTKQTIDLITLLGGEGILDKENVVQALDILKAHAISSNMDPSEFKLFASEKFETVLRDAKLTGEGNNLDANEAFRAGFVSYANGIDVRKIQVASITNRDGGTKMVEAEWGIFKTRDGIQYVVPYKNTVEYEITPDKVLHGGKAYQPLEYYDFFNLYPKRLYRVKIRYTGSEVPPTSF